MSFSGTLKEKKYVTILRLLAFSKVFFLLYVNIEMQMQTV